MGISRLIIAIALLSGCPKGSGPVADGGEVRVAGIEAPVALTWGEGGVVRIEARTDADAFFGLGWVHARERLAALDEARRLAFGRTAAWAGEEGLAFDAFARALDLRGQAERSLLRSGPEERTLLVAYADGVNAGAAAGLPPAYRRAGLGFEPFTPADALGVLHVEALAASAGLTAEIAALDLAALPTERLDAAIRRDGPAIEAGWEAVRAGTLPTLSEGAREWAARVAGPTRSAAAVAQADPPLLAVGVSLPPRDAPGWLAVDLRGRTFSVAGLTAPGVPAVWAGHNGRVAFALVPSGADATDLARVGVEGEWGYVAHGEARVMSTPEAVIEVRGGPDRVVAPPSTALGPVAGVDAEARAGWVLRYAGAERSDRTLPALWDLARADGAVAALDALDRPLAGSWRAVVVDVDGHVGDAIVGAVVRRRGFTGRVPHDASAAPPDWQGWVDRLPRVVDPPSGRVVAAGERPDWPAADALAASFPPPTRRDRLDQALGAGPVDAERAWRALGDEVVVGPFLPEGVSPETPEGARCAEVLRAWDGIAAPDRAGPLVWAALRDALVEEALGDIAPELVVAWRAGAGLDAAPPGRVDAARLGRALDRACTALIAVYGPDPSAWRWGRAHRHQPAGLLPGDRRVGPGVAGTGHTVAAAGWPMLAAGEGSWDPAELPAARLVIPLANPNAARVAVSGGVERLEPAPLGPTGRPPLRLVPR